MEAHANALGVDFEPTRAVFDLAKENGSVFEALAAHTPQLRATCEFLRTRIPLPRSAAVSLESHFYRLPSHNRSFCYSLAESGSFFEAPVIVFKGTEPLLRDFATLVDWMLQAPLRKSSRVMADHFSLAEGKIPGALSLQEATREAQIALQVQKNHLRHYGELARIPTPLLIHAFPEQRRKTCAELLRRKLSQAAFERIEPLLQSGLATYVYHYPAAPIRANYWGGMSSPQLTQHLQKTFSEDIAVSGWTKLLVRLFYLGYLPYSVRNEGLGACMDPGNAALDGGFCDLDSLVPIRGCADDFFREGAVQSVAILQQTIQLLLGLSNGPDLLPSVDEFVCGHYIQRLLNEAVAAEARPQLRLDDRFLKLISPRSIGDLKACTEQKLRVPAYTQFLKRPSMEQRPKQGLAEKSLAHLS